MEEDDVFPSLEEPKIVNEALDGEERLDLLKEQEEKSHELEQEDKHEQEEEEKKNIAYDLEDDFSSIITEFFSRLDTIPIVPKEVAHEHHEQVVDIISS